MCVLSSIANNSNLNTFSGTAEEVREASEDYSRLVEDRPL